jgi:glycosyltransferase involved in cell wall biosynthesis
MPNSAATVPRVLCVTGAYFPELSAGGLQCQAVARNLNGLATVRVLTTSVDPALPRQDAVDGIPVSRVPINTASWWSKAKAVVGMVSALVRELPAVDVVHIQGCSSKNILIAAMAKCVARPIVLHLQTARHDEPDTVRGHGRLAWWAFSTADSYISVSPGLSSRYLEAGLPSQRIREIPNGVDTSRFFPPSSKQRRALRQQLALPVDRPVVLFVGVMSRDKQPDVLLDAWLRLQPDPARAATLVFVGATDPALYELGDQLANLLRADAARSPFRDRVLFVSPTPRIQDYFQAADIFAMPSAREGLPIVLLEAMACGLPCVASLLPGSTDAIVTPGVDGILVPQGDARAMALALATLLDDPDRAQRMGTAARRTIEARYTVSDVAEQWLTVYRGVMAA